MEGYLRPRGKSKAGKDRYQIVIDCGKKPDGSRDQHFETVHGKREAQKRLASLMTQVNTGSYIDPSKITLAEHLRQWITHQRNRGLSTQVVDEYERICESHIIPQIGKYRLTVIKPLHVQHYYDDRLLNGRLRPIKVDPQQPVQDPNSPKTNPNGLAPQTVRNHHTLLHKALSGAVRLRLIPTNPAEFVEPPKVYRQEMRILDRNEIVKLLERARSTAYQIAFTLGISTGMRRGEMLALRWSDIDLDTRELTISRSLQQTKTKALVFGPTKNKKIRTISISARTVAELHAHKGQQAQLRLLQGPKWHDNDLVITRLDGSPVVPSTLTASFVHVVKRTDITQVRLHDLRHTHVALLIDQGEHPKVICDRLGHSSIAVTMDRYGHLFPGKDKDAADRFDAALGW